MFNLISYAYSQSVTNSVMIKEFAKFHILYIYMNYEIKPSQITIRKFIREKGYLFKPMMDYSLIFANELRLTEFKYLTNNILLKMQIIM